MHGTLMASGAVVATAFVIVASGISQAVHKTTVPSRFDNDGVYVRLKTSSGGQLELYTDTGGGSLIVSRAAATRLGMKVVPVTDPEARAELGADAGEAKAPKIGPELPPLPIVAYVVERPAQILSWPEQADGFVGAAWFAGHTWTWDYPHESLTVEGTDFKPSPSAHRVPIGFKVESDGSRTSNFARIEIHVAGDPLQMLLDTGAETILKPSAQEAIGGARGLRATSMIEHRIMQSWHEAHPDWRFVRDAQLATGASMIEVPHVVLAGIDVGHVWFTERPDANYDHFMSSMTDQPVVGSIGGNALRDLRMTMDFPGGQAWFEAVR